MPKAFRDNQSLLNTASKVIICTQVVSDDSRHLYIQTVLPRIEAPELGKLAPAALSTPYCHHETRATDGRLLSLWVAPMYTKDPQGTYM